jgi:hypothetical protein
VLRCGFGVETRGVLRVETRGVLRAWRGVLRCGFGVETRGVLRFAVETRERGDGGCEDMGVD